MNFLNLCSSVKIDGLDIGYFLDAPSLISYERRPLKGKDNIQRIKNYTLSKSEILGIGVPEDKLKKMEKYIDDTLKDTEILPMHNPLTGGKRSAAFYKSQGYEIFYGICLIGEKWSDRLYIPCVFPLETEYFKQATHLRGKRKNNLSRKL